MTHIKIENGQVIGEVKAPKDLVVGDNTVYNFIGLSDEDKKDYSYYKPTFTPLKLNSWESYGESSYTYDEATDEVLETREVKLIDLEQFKQTKINEIENTYQQIRNEGYTGDFGFELDITKESIDSIVKAKDLIIENNETTGGLVDTIGGIHNLSIDDYKAAVLETGLFVRSLYFKKIQFNTLINSKTTHEEVNEIYWREWVVTDEITLEGQYIYSEVL